MNGSGEITPLQADGSGAVCAIYQDYVSFSGICRLDS
ncbi:hypothetical protein SY94_5282 (plasmid) [Agrobacterium tumefaciens]|nr:hypothetical protein SY94_5282 [Agrobacterium tumefaciens]